MIKAIGIILCLLCSLGISAQNKPAYILYNAKGKQIGYDKMLKDLLKQEVVLFGEIHNNPISHWLELKIAQECGEKRAIRLGAEMFERDNQEPLNHYLNGKLTSKGLDSSTRLWKNYKTDYAPLVNYAKEKKLSFVATNVPRKFASMVSKGGFEALNSLQSLEKTWLAPLPITYDANLPGYQKMLTLMGDHASPNMAKAQALKDATMAYSILEHMKKDELFIHYHGSYHSEFHEGIMWYLQKSRADMRIATIATVSQRNIQSLLPEHLDKADYIICVEEDMTGTY
ncbi:MAG: hypothetical protein RL246_1893 [Bacteroidota bacterium]|jgi:uncharacterized iron-regulated protein